MNAAQRGPSPEMAREQDGRPSHRQGEVKSDNEAERPHLPPLQASTTTATTRGRTHECRPEGPEPRGASEQDGRQQGDTTTQASGAMGWEALSSSKGAMGLMERV